MIDGNIIVGNVNGMLITLTDALTAMCRQFIAGKLTVDEFEDIYAEMLCKAAGLDLEAVDVWIVRKAGENPPLGSPDAQ